MSLGKFHRGAALGLTSLLAFGSAAADEGMWLPSQTGALASTLKEAGLEIDPAVLADLQTAPLNAIVSLGGCSASFLSREGLIATNHHCVYGSIQYNSKPGQNYLADGFLAKTLRDELPAAPGTRAYVIEDLRLVTDEILAGVTDGMSGLERFEKIESNRKALIGDCEAQESRRCDVRPYFGGASYYLQQQLEIKDVRLVYAPAGGVGNFGGEVDNWQWPRHTGDFGFYRAYVAPDGASRPFDKANVPYRPKSHLKIAAKGLEEGDFVMLAGFPGVTDRLRTAGEAEYYYSSFYPKQQALLTEYSDQIARATAGNEDATIKYASIIRGSDNYKKKLLGQMAGADAVRLSERKGAEERAFRAWVAKDRARNAKYGPAIAALDAVVGETNDALTTSQIFGLINRAQLLSAARDLYRWAQEREKPDADRAPGYQDRDRQFFTERLTQIDRRFVPSTDRALFENALAEYRKLPLEKRDAAFDNAVASIGMDRLYAETKLGDLKTRLGLMEASAADIAASEDPFLKLAVALSPGDLERERIGKDRAGRTQKARAACMEAMFAYAKTEGRTLYPDANGSLRFTYGKITGKSRDGLSWTSFTTAEGLAEKHTGKAPFNAPAKMLAAIEKKDYGRYASPELETLPVNYLSTVDITNGNSGSATLNAKGEFVGLAFDGTLDGVIADWWYEPSINRTIHVDSRFMLWTMDKIDGAKRLLQEMGVE